MKELSRIQKRHNLNEVFVVDQPHEVSKGNHVYHIAQREIDPRTGLVVELKPLLDVNFQNGPRKEDSSIHGVLDTDLLEVVRHRLIGFQSGPYATRENAIALTHIEEALMWMNKRVEDREERGVLGTNTK
jgi:hypothetical protein